MENSHNSTHNISISLRPEKFTGNLGRTISIYLSIGTARTNPMLPASGIFKIWFTTEKDKQRSRMIEQVTSPETTGDPKSGYLNKTDILIMKLLCLTSQKSASIPRSWVDPDFRPLQFDMQWYVFCPRHYHDMDNRPGPSHFRLGINK
jgi:hypothetical protein